MGIRDLTLGLGGGLLAATLVFGAADALLPKSGEGTPEPKTSDQQATQQADLTVLPKAEYEQKLADARAEGAKQKADELAQQKQQEAAQAPNKVYVYIQPGMGTTDVALLLQAAGVLSNGNELIQLRQQQTNPIRSGTYLLPLKGDAKEVMKLIATPPAN
ncbi:MAG: hypothetical protein WCC10_07565 [Tumebacillaceae bacterium]